MKLRLYFILISLIITTYICSQEPIPESKGFSGYLQPVIGFLNNSNNTVSKLQGITFAQSQISSIYNSPSPQNKLVYTIPFNFGYTIRPSKTYFFIENRNFDIIRINETQQIGIKQRVNAQGILQAGFIFTAIPTWIWEDPYVINRNRNNTKYKEYGTRIGIDKFWGSDLLILYTYRSISIENELSGQSVDLTPENLALLNRNGEIHQVNMEYKFNINKVNRITPAFEYCRESKKGKSRSNTAYSISFQYLLNKPKYTFSTKIKTANIAYDIEHPVYNIKQVDNTYEIYTSLLYQNPWDIKFIGEDPISLIFIAGYYAVDSNIEFYEMKGLVFLTGLKISW